MCVEVAGLGFCSYLSSNSATVSSRTPPRLMNQTRTVLALTPDLTSGIKWFYLIRTWYMNWCTSPGTLLPPGSTEHTIGFLVVDTPIPLPVLGASFKEIPQDMSRHLTLLTCNVNSGVDNIGRLSPWNWSLSASETGLLPGARHLIVEDSFPETPTSR